jgi:hypothetical protein
MLPLAPLVPVVSSAKWQTFSSILEYKGFGPSKNWVDDFVFFGYPVSSISSLSSFSYSLADIYTLTSQLGWPWKDSKTKPFSSHFKYLGFSWSLSVEILPEKKARYLAKLLPWNPNQRFSRKDTELLLGTLIHCSLALPDGCSHLPALSHFAASFNHFSSTFVCRSPSPAVIADIHWWRTQLSAGFCRSIITKPPHVFPLEFWVDALSSWGIGIVFDNVWDAWKLRAGWNEDGHDIGWAVIVAIELGILFAVHLGHSNTHFLIKSNNQGVIYAIERGRSRNSEQNRVLQWITSLLSQHSTWIFSLYVAFLDNLADPPSCGLPVHSRS